MCEEICAVFFLSLITCLTGYCFKIEQGRRQASYWEYQALKVWYERVMGVRREAVPAAYTRSRQTLPLPDFIRRKLGKTYRFFGHGVDYDFDRIFVRESLDRICKSIGWFAEEVIVRLPCSIIKGNVQLLASNSDVCYGPTRAKTLKELADSHLVLLAVDHRGVTDDMAALLKSSGFLTQLTRPGSDRRVLILNLSEERQSSSHRANGNAFAGNNIAMTQQILKDFRTFLEKQNVATAMVAEIVESTKVLSVRPVMYQSLILNKDHVIPQRHGFKSLASMRSSTQVPALMGYIRNMIVSRCAGPIMQLSQGKDHFQFNVARYLCIMLRYEEIPCSRSPFT